MFAQPTLWPSTTFVQAFPLPALIIIIYDEIYEKCKLQCGYSYMIWYMIPVCRFHVVSKWILICTNAFRNKPYFVGCNPQCSNSPVPIGDSPGGQVHASLNKRTKWGDLIDISRMVTLQEQESWSYNLTGGVIATIGDLFVLGYRHASRNFSTK